MQTTTLPVVEVEAKPAILGIGEVIESSEVKESAGRYPGKFPPMYHFRLKFKGLYTTPDNVSKMVMFDPAMFTGPSPLNDLSEELLKQFIIGFASKEEWAALSPEDFYRVNRANQFYSTLAFVVPNTPGKPQRHESPSFLQSLFGDEDYLQVLKDIEGLGATPTPEAIASIISTAAIGRSVVGYYVQAKERNDDGSKSLSEFYEIRDVTPLTEDSLKAAIKRAAKAKNPTLLGWEN